MCCGIIFRKYFCEKIEGEFREEIQRSPTPFASRGRPCLPRESQSPLEAEGRFPVRFHPAPANRWRRCRIATDQTRCGCTGPPPLDGSREIDSPTEAPRDPECSRVCTCHTAR